MEKIPGFMPGFIPKKMFFTSGVGVDKHQLTSFEIALRDAGIHFLNLITVSSIYPPGCLLIPKLKGLTFLRPGQITPCVLARQATDEPNRLIAASIGLARPKDRKQFGYLSEHHSFGETKKIAGDFAEDLAATMLAKLLKPDLKFDPNQAWDARREVYRAGGLTFVSRNITQTAQGQKDGLWTTVVAAAVFLT